MNTILSSVFDSYLLRIITQHVSMFHSAVWCDYLPAYLIILANFGPTAKWKRAAMKKKFELACENFVLGLTDRCNLQCQYCYAQSSPNNGHNMSIKAAVTLINEMHKTFGITFITVSGGEPIPAILELAELCHDKVFLVYTNGTTLKKEAIHEIRRLGNIIIALTLVGSKAVHDSIRGINNYNTVIEVAAELGQKFVPWGFSVTESQANLEEIASGRLFTQIAEYQPLFVRMIPYMPTGRDAHELALNIGDRTKITKAILAAKRKHGLWIHDYVHDDSIGISCMAGGTRFFYVDPQLRITPCVFMDIAEQIEYDPDAQTTNVLEILKTSPLMKRARELAVDNRCIILDYPEWQEDLKISRIC